MGGVLTNYRVVRKSVKFQKENTFTNSLCVMRYIPSLLFLFFIPIIIFFLIIFNIIADKFFNNFLFRKYLYLGVFLIFLIIAPPDLFIQIFIVPLIFLILELYIYIITLFYLLYKTFRRWPSG